MPSRARRISVMISARPVLLWLSTTGAAAAVPGTNVSACGQYSSRTFSASWCVVIEVGASPSPPAYSRQQSMRARRVANL